MFSDDHANEHDACSIKQAFSNYIIAGAFSLHSYSRDDCLAPVGSPIFRTMTLNSLLRFLFTPSCCSYCAPLVIALCIAGPLVCWSYVSGGDIRMRSAYESHCGPKTFGNRTGDFLAACFLYKHQQGLENPTCKYFCVLQLQTKFLSHRQLK